MKNSLPWPLILKTKRLELRPYEESDHAAWIAGYTKRLAPQHKYDGGPHDPAETPKSWFRRLLKNHRAKAAADALYVWGIFEKKSGRHLGTVDLSTIQRGINQSAQIGYVIHNTEQGKGFGKEATRAALKAAFQKLGYKRVEAAINLDNKRSFALAESIGMKREGVRKEYLFENGKWVDHVIYVALNPRKEKAAYPLL